jgi:nucleotide-binding universal stress UspA family protein
MTVKIPKIKTILYCTQLGPNSAYVFLYAYALAKSLGARIAVLHVVETLSPSQESLLERYSGEGSVDEIVERQEAEARERIEKRIARFLEKVGEGEDAAAAAVGQVIIAEGRVRRQILAHVESEGADLVVMGAHAESTLLEGLLGGTAQKVLKSCPVPVLVVQVPEGLQDLTVVDV